MKEKPIWTRTKFWYAVMAIVSLLILAITDTVVFNSQEIMTIILSLLGISVGGHALTDVAGIITGKANRKRDK